jgi:hypothetical protein
MDLFWEGAQEAQNLKLSNRRPEDRIAEWGSGHYEQIGHVTGTVTCEGETLEIDCHDFKDRSSGPRGPLRNMAGGGFDLGWASERTSFCVTMVRADPRAPITTDSVDQPGYGFFTKDGEIGTVVSGERRVVERAPDGRALRVVLDLVDDRGRELHAEGRARSHLKWHDLWFVHWGTGSWEIEGESGWGQMQDWLDVPLIRAYQREQLKQQPSTYT